MKRLALAASLLVAAGCTPPDTDIAVSGELPERVVVRAQSVDLSGVWPTPATAPGATTTTTSTVPPTTVPPAPAPQVSHTPAGPSGNCGGWEGLIASYFPADAVAAACVIARCESEWNASAIGGPNRNGTYDVGLFQINDIHGLSRAERLDPETNVAFAVRLYAGSGWRPWTCRKALV